jgi:hypothetical protein
MHNICPAHLPTGHHNNILWKVKIMKLLKPTVTSFLLGINMPLGNLFSNILNICSSLRMTDHVYTHKKFT